MQVEQDARNFWLEDTDRCKALSHWRDHNDNFDSIGGATLIRTERLCKMAGKPVEFVHAMDWGCGGGANVAWLVKCSQITLGVDISLANLDETERVIDLPGGHTFEPVYAPVNPSPLNVTHEWLDFFLCTTVFQHLPSKAHGEAVLRFAYYMLNSGAPALIQIATRDIDKGEHPEYHRHFTRWTTWSEDHFKVVCHDVGFQVLEIERELDYAYFYLRRPPRIISAD
jgi:hypothetical protein